jgi:hypothetical protein
MEMETNIFAFLGNMSHNVCGQLVMFTFDSTVHPYCSWGYVLENPCVTVKPQCKKLRPYGKNGFQEPKT